MGFMKMLAIAMEDNVLDDEKLEDIRRDGWHDSIAGTHDPLKYYGNTKNMQTYFLGHLQYHSAISEYKTMRDVKPKIRPKVERIRPKVERDVTCGCTGCTNLATHTWSGHPTCDDCATPARKGWTPPNHAHNIIEDIRDQIGWLRLQIGPQNADKINEQLTKLKELT